MQTILKSIHGSHLYGTATPDSDIDYKGVFQESLDNIILGKAKDAINLGTKSVFSREKNTKDDVDYVVTELRKFIKDCINGEMHAIDMLFTPPTLWLEYSPTWEDIISKRNKLVSSNLHSFKGYIQKQIGKYGSKGSNVGEVRRVRDWALSFDSTKRVGEVIDTLTQSDSVQLTPCVKDSGTIYLKVLSKQYQLTIKLSQLIESLDKWMDKYGARSIQAADNQNVDFKAVSHALRGVYQCTELLETGNIIFPLSCAELLKEVKQGVYSYMNCEKLFELGMEKLNNVTPVIPAEIDTEFWENWIVDQYY